MKKKVKHKLFPKDFGRVAPFY